MASEGTSTPAPEDNSTPAPAGSSTLAPACSCTPAPPGSSTSVPKDSFTAVSSSPEWNEGLKRFGSCLKLFDLLQNRPELIHELGPDGITVLHKGVHHGCVKLVRFVLVDMFNEAGMCNCKGEENGLCALTREGLLRKTTEYGSTAVNMAIMSGSPKMVLLLDWAIRVSDKVKKTVNTDERTSHPVDNGELLRIASLINRERSREMEPVVNVVDEVPVLLRSAGLNNGERSEEIVPVVNVVDEVPDVKDDEISESIYLQEKGKSEKTYDRDMQLELYKIIAGKLNEGSTGEYGLILNVLKDSCAKNVDFEFVPVEHVFLHFLLSHGIEMSQGQTMEVRDMILEFESKFFKRIVAECKMWDEKNKTKQSKNKTTETMQMTLFSILDPQGRTIMQTLFHTLRTVAGCFIKLLDLLGEVAKPWRCYTAKDGAGRTLYHMASIYDPSFRSKFEVKTEQYPHVNIEVTPLCYNELKALRVWSFEKTSADMMEECHQIPIYLAVLFNSKNVMSTLLQGLAKEVPKSSHPTPFQMAAGLGRTKLVEQFLKHQKEFKNILDGGFHRRFHEFEGFPALHFAATSGQVEVIQMILKYPIYDPICQDTSEKATALHAVVGMHLRPHMESEYLGTCALQHVLPNSKEFKYIERDFLKSKAIKSSPRDFTKNEKICINLLLQAGIDMWTPKINGEVPNVGLNANNEARSWWYDKVVKEVEIKKANITSAANATSVIGALVATTSFIGPLQPPLSYSPESGYINANPISIQIYLVCNSISFFFSIASILMAVLPSIPMPKESLYEEMRRSERCLKTAIALLLNLSFVYW